jgi:muramoyltetrapeptide carboxypeptidase LdcA involved in peptidoglycan recycling
MQDCVPRKLDPGFYSDVSAEEVFEYYLKDLGVPVLYGLPLGHTEDLATAAHGVRSDWMPIASEFEILESGVLKIEIQYCTFSQLN